MKMMEQLLNGEQNMKAAVFFPGIGYHCDKPLLYYSRKLAQECGYEETIALSYTYDGGNIRGNEEKCSRHSKAFMNRQRKVFLPLTLTNMMKYYLSQA